MALILNIETSTTNCSVSLADNGSVLSLKEDNNEKYSHSESLHVFIDNVINESSFSISEIDAIAISEGPGSYTGLRIGVSAAKGLCFALNKPLISISTLQSLAQQVKVDSGYIISMLDARRMEVYAAVYKNDYNEIKSVWPEIITSTSFDEYFGEENIYFIGNTNEKVKDIIKHPRANYLDFTLPSSREMAPISFKKFNNKDFEDLAYFEPKYLKAFQAHKKSK